VTRRRQPSGGGPPRAPRLPRHPWLFAAASHGARWRALSPPTPAPPTCTYAQRMLPARASARRTTSPAAVTAAHLPALTVRMEASLAACWRPLPASEDRRGVHGARERPPCAARNAPCAGLRADGRAAQVSAFRPGLARVSIARVCEAFGELGVPLGAPLAARLQARPPPAPSRSAACAPGCRARRGVRPGPAGASTARRTSMPPRASGVHGALGGARSARGLFCAWVHAAHRAPCPW